MPVMTDVVEQKLPAPAVPEQRRQFLGRCADCWVAFTVDDTLVYVPVRMVFVHEACG